MKRLNNPISSYNDIISACTKGIPLENILKQKIEQNENLLINTVDNYESKAKAGELFSIQLHNTQDIEKLTGLTSEDFHCLYKDYFVPKKKPAREFYDKILLLNQQKCPFCGGIGTSYNLDHYLPKKLFPQFSIFQLNLIPSCRDCNMGSKGATYALSKEEQILHPYLDADHFFNKQWIIAQYHKSSNDEPPYLRYYVQPPSDWSPIDKERVKNHFIKFKIGKQYEIKAAEELVDVQLQLQEHLKKGDFDSYKDTCLKPVATKLGFPNHWKRIMYQALIDDM